MVGRTAFGGDLLYSIGVSGFIYPILGHWVWGPDGWLATWNTPFRDFAGSTVVHTIGGMIALPVRSRSVLVSVASSSGTAEGCRPVTT